MNDLDVVFNDAGSYSDGSTSWSVPAGMTPRTSPYAPWNIMAWIAAENARAAAQQTVNRQWEQQLNEQITGGGPITVSASPALVGSPALMRGEAPVMANPSPLQIGGAPRFQSPVAVPDPEHPAAGGSSWWLYLAAGLLLAARTKK
jgi:hypothetical protein